ELLVGDRGVDVGVGGLGDLVGAGLAAAADLDGLAVLGLAGDRRDLRVDGLAAHDADGVHGLASAAAAPGAASAAKTPTEARARVAARMKRMMAQEGNAQWVRAEL